MTVQRSVRRRIADHRRIKAILTTLMFIRVGE